jgi:hypothetical protein
MEQLWFASRNSGAKRREPNSHEKDSRAPRSRDGRNIMNHLTCSQRLRIHVSPDLNFKELAQVQVSNEYKAELEEATLLHPSSSLLHTGFRRLPAAICSATKDQAWPRAIGACRETNEEAEKLKNNSTVFRRKGLSKSYSGRSCTVAAALPNPSLKLSTNGVHAGRLAQGLRPILRQLPSTPHRWRPLSSNVRPCKRRQCTFVITQALVPVFRPRSCCLQIPFAIAISGKALWPCVQRDARGPASRAKVPCFSVRCSLLRYCDGFSF